MTFDDIGDHIMSYYHPIATWAMTPWSLLDRWWNPKVAQ